MKYQVASVLISLFPLIISPIVSADNNPLSTLAIKNDSNYYYLLDTTQLDNAGCNQNCYQALTPKGAEQWVNLWQQSGWIDIQYDVCKDVTYSESGDASCNGYLGHFGITFTPKNTSLSVSQDGVATLSPNKNNQIFKVNFKPSNSDHHKLPKPTVYDTIQLRGVNIAAAEFSSSNGSIEWIINSAFPKETDLSYFANKGMNTYRFPIRWSYIQPKRGGDLNQAYLNKLIASARQYLDAGYSVIIDLHNYMHFQSDATKEPVNSGELITKEDFKDIWDRLTTALKPLALEYPNATNSNQLIFDLMNEPTEDITAKQTLDYYNTAIDMIREKGLTNLILLEGPHYSGMHSWLSAKDSAGMTNSEVFIRENIKDPSDNYAINVHQYFDSNYSGTALTCTGYPESNILNFITWTKENNLPYMVTEFGGADNGGCQEVISSFLKLLEDKNNDELFLGWTAWAGGSFWGNYILSMYKNGGAEGLPDYLIDNQHLKRPEVNN